MLGRSLTLALLGLSSLIQAVPIAPRQDTFSLGEPLPADPQAAIAELEVQLEYLQDLPYRTHAQWGEEGAIKALLYYVYGITSISAPDGTTTTITISSRQNTFTFGSALPSQETEAIDELQVNLEQLQNLSHKTRADWELIGAIQALLYYKYNIVSETAPPGTSTTLTPGKRQESFTLGGSLPSDKTQAIEQLEVDLEALQDKPNKSWQDYELIGAIRGLLYYTYGITSISAPDGTTTTLTPGKRQDSFLLGSGASSSGVSSSASSSSFTIGKRQELIGSIPSDENQAIAYLEVKLEELQNAPPSPQVEQAIWQIKVLLYFTYHITSISAPDGTTTTLTIGKRQNSVETIIGSVPSGEKAAIAYLEVKLESLENVKHPSKVQKEAISAIKTLLYYTYHITSISAPSGTTTTLTPGKL